MNKVIICVGLPGSGKTTWAKKQTNAVRVNKDDLRAMIDDGQWSKNRETLILSLRDSAIIKGLRMGRDVIVDDTNLAEKHIARIAEVVEEQGKLDGKDYQWEVKTFDIDLHDAIKHDIQRDRTVGEDVIRNMYNQFIRPNKRIVSEDQVADRPNLPDAVIFDLDGTLALLNGRNPYDASQCEYDLLNHPVYNALRRYQADGYKIIITSGRKEEYVEQTSNWLAKNGIAPDLFCMRKTGDDRQDAIVKREMYMDNIFENYNVEVVYDDRMRVVDMWRDLGLTVFQVAEGRF